MDECRRHPARGAWRAVYLRVHHEMGELCLRRLTTRVLAGPARVAMGRSPRSPGASALGEEQVMESALTDALRPEEWQGMATAIRVTRMSGFMRFPFGVRSVPV